MSDQRWPPDDSKFIIRDRKVLAIHAYNAALGDGNSRNLLRAHDWASQAMEDMRAVWNRFVESRR